MVKIIVPSSLVVPNEQQTLGKLPAIIYPVNQKIMLDFLLEQYRDIASGYVISLYEEAEKARRVIERYSENIHVCELDALRDIGYSVYFALKQANIQQEDSVIINYADVVAFDAWSQEVGDMILYSEEKPSSKWAYFSESCGVINDIVYNPEDISRVNSSKMFIGVFGIKNAFEFMEILEDEIRNREELDSFFRALKKYNEKYLFKIEKSVQWFDVGHADKYIDAQIEVKARSFNHIFIDKNRGTLTKKSDEKEKFIGEILWYLKLPSDVAYSRPRIFNYSTEYTNPYVTMEYYPYHTLHELMVYGNLEKSKWETIFEKIRFVLNDYGRYSVTDDGIKKALYEMYIEKTLSRIEQLHKREIFDDFWDEGPVVNGEETIGLNELKHILPRIVEENLMDVGKFQLIHGDLCFTNIMVDPNCNFIKLIDPRGGFGKYDIYGDLRYELAKLLHSCEGKYDYIIKDMFSLKRNGKKIEFHIKEEKRNFEIKDCFLSAFKENFGDEQEYKKVQLVEALLFFSMISLHTETDSRPIAMLCTGMQLLKNLGFI